MKKQSLTKSRRLLVLFATVLSVVCLTMGLILFGTGCTVQGENSGNPSGGHVHSFGNWTIVTDSTCAKTGLRKRTCSCGEEETDVIGKKEHTPGAQATCTDSQVCTVCGEVLVESKGHTPGAEATCTKPQTCTVCGATLVEAKGHIGDRDEATCVLDQVCTECGTVMDACVGHHTVDSWGEPTKTLKSGCTYTVTREGTCTVCGETVKESHEEDIHERKEVVVSYAKCNEDGKKQYVCAKCDEVLESDDYTDTVNKTFTYSDASAHNYVLDSEHDGIETYKCSYCEQTKTVVNYSSKVEQEIPKSVVDSAKEIQLKNAALELDNGTKDLLGSATTVEIKADTKGVDEVVIDEDKKAQIGNNPIYDFSLKADGAPITDFENNKIKITVPYTLDQGEDPESIAIWYINDSGNVESIPAVYREIEGVGYAEFETSHFSYYTVTRLSAEERCAVYGHKYTTVVKEATCTSAGYEMRLCSRCGEMTVISNTPALGHDYRILKDESVDATCTSSGKIVRECAHCGNKIETETAMLGHDTIDVITPATCLTDGYMTHTCKTCGIVYKDTYVSALGHNYKDTVIEPTCLEGGYTLHVCANCGDEYQDSETEKAPHTFLPAEPTCGEGQVCVVCGEEGSPATGEHHMENGVCTVCGEGCEHNFTEVVTEPTCTERGYTTKTCTKCHIETVSDYTDALGHNGFPVCERCGEQSVSDNFFYNLTGLYKEQAIYLSIDALEFKYTANGKEQSFKLADGAEFAITCDADFNYEIYIGGNGTFSTADRTDSAKAIVQFIGNKMYVRAIEESENGNNDSTVVFDVSSIIENVALSQVPEKYKGLVEELEGLLLKALKADYAELFAPVIKNLAIKSMVFTKVDNGFEISFKQDLLENIIDSLTTMTVKEIYEAFFGTGSYAELDDTIIALLDWTPNTILTFLDNANIIKKSDILELLDEVAVVLSEGQVETMNDMVKYMLRDETETFNYLNVKVSTILNLFMGNGQDVTENIIEKIKQTISGFENLTLLDIVKQFTGMEISEEMIQMVKGIAGDVSEILNEYFTFVIKTDANGNVKGATLKLNKTLSVESLSEYLEKYHMELPIDVEVSAFNADLQTGAFSKKQNYTSEKAAADNYIEKIKALDWTKIGKVEEIEGVKYLIVTEEYENMWQGEAGTDENGNTFVVYPKSLTTYKINISDPSFVINKDCGNWRQISFQFTEYTTYRVMMKIEGNSGIKTEISRTKEYSGKTYSYNVSVNFANGKIEKNNYEGHHKWVEVESLKKEYVPCTGENGNHNSVYGETHYACTNCGARRVVYFNYDYEHTVRNAQLKTPGSSCEDGVIISVVCESCGKENHHYENNYHETCVDKEIIDLEQYGCECGGELIIRECACGEVSYAEINCECESESFWFYDEELGRGVEVNICPACGFIDATYDVTEEFGTCGRKRVVVYLLGCELEYGGSDKNGKGNDVTGIKSFKRKIEVVGEIYYAHDFEETGFVPDGNDPCKGMIYSTCNNCGVTQSWYGTRHDMQQREERDVREGCTVYDVVTHYCTRCGYSYTDKYNYRTEHLLDEESVIEPTCTQVGHGRCNICGKDIYFAPSLHIFVQQADKFVCENCGQESSSPVTGFIAMENLSRDGRIVVGFCGNNDRLMLRSEDEFDTRYTCVVSVITEDEEVVLNGLNYYYDDMILGSFGDIDTHYGYWHEIVSGKVVIDANELFDNMRQLEVSANAVVIKFVTNDYSGNDYAITLTPEDFDNVFPA